MKRVFSPPADALDAMTTTRAYHRGLSADQAREEIAGNAAGQLIRRSRQWSRR